MAMIQNAFANSSFSLLVGKIQGNIVDYLMPPLSTGRADRRADRSGGHPRVPGRLRGVAGDAAVAGRVGRGPPARAGRLWFGLMGALMLAFLGLLTSLWADKFDHAAAVTNFVVTPLSLLSRHLLFGPPARAGIPGGQPRQSLLLRDLGLSRRLPGRQQFAAVGRRDRAAGAEPRAVGGLLSRC